MQSWGPTSAEFLDALQARVKEAQRVADFAMVERLAGELSARAAEAGATEIEANAFAYVGGARVANNDAHGAREAFARARELYEEARCEAGVVRALNGLAVVALDIELDVYEARRLIDRALLHARDVHDAKLLAQVLGNLAEVQRYEAQYTGALRSARRALAILDEIGDKPRAAWQLINIAHCHFLRRDREVAIATLRSAYDHLTGADYDARVLCWYFDLWFIVAAGYGEYRTAALLLGFVKRLRDEKNLVRLQLLLPWISAPTEEIARTFTAQQVDELIHEGGLLTLEEAEALTHGPPFDAI